MLGRRSVGHRLDGSGGRWPRRARRTLRTVQEHDEAGRRWLDGQLAGLGVPYELFACDPALADTAAFCEAYGFAPEDSANTIVVIGKCRSAALRRLRRPRAVPAGRQPRRPRPPRDAQGVVRAGRATRGAHRHADRRRHGLRAAGRPADLGRRAGDGPRADRARRRVAVVEGHLDAGDPAGAARASRSSRGSRPSRRRAGGVVRDSGRRRRGPYRSAAETRPDRRPDAAAPSRARPARSSTRAPSSSPSAAPASAASGSR